MSNKTCIYTLDIQDVEDICEILGRRANEIADFKGKYTENASYFGSVELALSREITRLRRLRDCFDNDSEVLDE